MGVVGELRELKVYCLAFDLQQDIFGLSKRFPREEIYSLTDQVRRSSRSVGANIAEAWRKRRHLKEFRQKLSIADAELSETQHWLDTAIACGYLQKEQYEFLSDKAKRIGRMLNHVHQEAKTWILPSNV